MEALGNAPTAWESPNGNGLMQPRAASPAMEAALDTEVQKVVDRAYYKCKECLTVNRALLDKLALDLIEKETIDYDELSKMRDEHCQAQAALGIQAQFA